MAAPSERFAQCCEYLDACYEAWKAVFDSYDALLRTFRSLSPQLTEELTEMLKEFKRQIEDKKSELEMIYDGNIQRVRAGSNIQDTPPLAFKMDFSFTKLLKVAWPNTPQIAPPPIAPPPVITNGGNVPSPPKIAPIGPPQTFQQIPQVQMSAPLVFPVAQPSAPPGFDYFGMSTGQDRVRSWVQSTSTAPPPGLKTHQAKSPVPVPAPMAIVTSKTTLDDDEFETFGNGVQQNDEEEAVEEPPNLKEPISNLRRDELDDFDTFGPDSATVTPRPVVPTIQPMKPVQTSQTSSGGNGSQQGATGGSGTLPDGDPETVVKIMRCIEFLTNKIRSKFGEQQQAPLTKVYGHLSQEEGYRALIGGGPDFAEFLARYPDYFKLSSDRAAVILTRDACRRASDALKMAEKQVVEWQKLGQHKKQPVVAKKTSGSEQPQPQPSLATKKASSHPSRPKGTGSLSGMKASLMDMDEYGDSDERSSSGSHGRAGVALDDDEFDEFGGGNENAKPPPAQPVQPQLPRQPVISVAGGASRVLSSGASNHQQPLTYWEIVEMVVKRLDLSRKYETYDVGKQVAVEAVKFAMQTHDMTSNFGQMNPDTIVGIVQEFISRGAESVKRKQQAQRQDDSTLAQAGISDKMLAEWKYKTILCSDYAANSQCPRGGSCGFAHGKNDLRPRRRVKLCSSYNAGTCRKSAEECNNAHGTEYLGTIMPGQEHLLANIPPAAPVQPVAPTTTRTLAPAPAPSKSYWKGTTTTPSAPANFQDTDQSCSICLDSMRDTAVTQVSQLRCGHRFHMKCFADWKSKGASTCPKCRISIVDDNDFPSLS